MNGDREDSGASYMPERYKQQIAARKRRAFYVKIIAAGSFVILCAAVYLVLAGSLTGITHETPVAVTVSTPPTTSAVSTPSPATTRVTASMNASGAEAPVLSAAVLAAGNDTGILPFGRASAYLREDYPASSYALVSADITGSPPHQRYAFEIRNIASDASGETVTVYMDAVTGDPYVPGQESAGITPARAKNIVTDSFPDLHPDSVRLLYTPGSGGGPAWNFTLYRNNNPILSGNLDSETGQIDAFSRDITASGRPARPALDAGSAQSVAGRYISDQNGPVAVNLSDERYVPLGTGISEVAGLYVLDYQRLVQNYPCDIDGFTIKVDSVSGGISGYERRWNDPEYAFVVSPVPTVLRREATYTVLHKAQDTFPGLAPGITIISADIQWKDAHPSGTVPRPSSIPLAWKVVFDDELIRADPEPIPAVAWVDIQTGELLEFDYQH